MKCLNCDLPIEENDKMIPLPDGKYICYCCADLLTFLGLAKFNEGDVEIKEKK